MTAAYHHTGVFSIKNPTIESEVSWSSLLSFYTLEEQSFQHLVIVLGGYSVCIDKVIMHV